MSEWSHLPNAKHIDWALESVKANPEKWKAAWDAARGAAWGAAWTASSAAWKAAWGAARRDAARDAAMNAAWTASSAGWNAAWSAISALVAWDHSVKYLKMTPDQLRVWYALSDDPACILLLPAVMVLQEEMEMA